MSLPRPGYDYCPSCYGGPGGFHEECRCSKRCAECGGLTNHTTAQHEAAMAPRCVDCDDPITHTDDPDVVRCLPCADEYQADRFVDWCDARAKEDPHGD